MRSAYIALAFALCCAAPAMAQSSTSFENQATTIANACLVAEVTPEAASATVVTCEKVITDIAALRQAHSAIAGHDLNVYHVITSMAHSRIGHAYGKVDGVRSARVCQRVEAAWESVSRIDAAASPAYASFIKDMRDASIAATGKCRAELGTPTGATPLPT